MPRTKKNEPPAYRRKKLKGRDYDYDYAYVRRDHRRRRRDFSTVGGHELHQIEWIHIEGALKAHIQPIATTHQKAGGLEVVWGKVRVGGRNQLVVASRTKDGETKISLEELPEACAPRSCLTQYPLALGPHSDRVAFYLDTSIAPS